MQEGKLVLFSAPSGSGKTTLVRWLLDQPLNLSFSVSATSRPPRPNEVHGTDYFFLSPEAFREKIETGAFLEWEEVYTDKYYGTLRSEVERMLAEGRHVLLDVDVKGGINIKRLYGSKALAVFVEPPSIEVLRQRLENRGTDSQAIIEERVKKAAWELSFADNFDTIIINDDLETAKADCLNAVKTFLEGSDNKHE
ncbi:MAG: guanylate kinase [Bacteroidales bacterium]|nr:guanylate kinase [Bacteroidales bacterium]